MKKYILVALLAMGMVGSTTIVFAQEQTPKEEKKNDKMEKKDLKAEEKENKGKMRKAAKKHRNKATPVSKE